MTREEAASIIEDRVRVTEYVESSYVDCVDIEALKMAIEALKGKDTNVPSRKGVFIHDITVEMFRNASLEGVGELMASGEMEDISFPSAQQERRWIPCSERLPEEHKEVLTCSLEDFIEIQSIEDNCDYWENQHGDWSVDEVVAWMPLPEPYREGKE